MISLSEAALRFESGAMAAPEIARPALAGAHDVQEVVDVEGDRRRHATGQNGLEMAPRQPVPSPEEERPRQFQAHPYELGAVDQDHPECGDGPVVEFLSLVVAVGLCGLFQRRHADVEQQADALVQVGVRRLLGRGSRRQHQARQQGGQQNGH